MIEQVYILSSKLHQIVITVLGALIAFLTPIHPLIILVLLFIILDTCVGIWKSKRLDIKITSKALSAIVGKILLYESALILFWFMDLYIIGSFIEYATNIPFVLTKLIAVTLIWIEVKSLDESVTEVTGISFFKKMKQMIARVKSIKSDLENDK